MCNFKHEDSKHIPDTIAYKIFRYNSKDNQIAPMFGGSCCYKKDNKGYYTWGKTRGMFCRDGEGFCCFRTLGDAQCALHAVQEQHPSLFYSNLFILQIACPDGIDVHMENQIVTGFTFETGITKRFKIIANGMY